MKPAMQIELKPTAAILSQQQGDLTAMAELIRSVYIRQYQAYMPEAAHVLDRVLPMWDGTETSSGAVYRPEWPKLANFVVAHSMNPITFIRLEFAHTGGKEVPMPDMLRTEGAVQRYRKYAENRPAKLNDELQYSLSSLQVRVTELSLVPRLTLDQRNAMALQDYRVEAGPLFRYCMAVLAELSAVAEHFRAQRCSNMCSRSSSTTRRGARR